MYRLGTPLRLQSKVLTCASRFRKFEATRGSYHAIKMAGREMDQPMKASDTNIWLPLEGSDSIRVLEVVAGASEGSFMQCKLHRTTIGSPECPYIAISYAWGMFSSLEWKEIRCDDRKAFITHNLHSALTRAKDKLAGTLLNDSFFWVDALCINQSSDQSALKERAAQVQMMDRIFGNAKMVIIDLGSITPEDIEMLNCLSQKFAAIPEEDWNQALATAPIDASDSSLRHFDLPSLQEDSFWNHFAALVSRPYFSRVWVIQEMVLARRSMVMIGRNLREVEILQTCLLRATKYFWRRFNYFESRGDSIGVSKVMHISTVMSVAQVTITGLINLGAVRYYPEKLFDFSTLLSLTRYYQASDIRDKAFALRGLANDKDIERLYVDYEESAETCARRVSEYLIDQGKGAWLLYNCRGASASGSSWTYELSPALSSASFNELSQHIIPSGARSVSAFKACGETEVHISLSTNGDHITASGFMLDSVLVTASPMPLGAFEQAPYSSDSAKKMHDWFQEILAWTTKYHSLQNAPLDDFRIQCWRVIATDRYRHGTKNPRIHEAPATLFDSLNAFAEFAQMQPNDPEYNQKLTRSLAFFRSTVLGVGKHLAISQQHTILCLLPSDARPGDLLAIFEGCIIPFCLRKDTGHEDCFRIVGPCYVHGFMDGEVLTTDKYKRQNIVLR